MASKAVKETLHNIWRLIKLSYNKFSDENTMGMAAALAYYTMFSLPPILIVIISLSGFIIDQEDMKQHLFSEISLLIGSESTDQIFNIIDQIGLFQQVTWATVLSIVILLFTGTTLFSTIKRSLNHIFRVKAKPKYGILKELRDRALSLGMIVIMGLILMGSLVLNTLVNVADVYVIKLFPNAEGVIHSFGTSTIPFFLDVLTFLLVLRILPDARLKWKDAMVGAVVIALLFNLGKHLINLYVNHSTIANIQDAAGSVLVIMVWIFYSSIIFYFGAQLTYVYSNIFGSRILPSKNAVRIQIREAEQDEFF